MKKLIISLAALAALNVSVAQAEMLPGTTCALYENATITVKKGAGYAYHPYGHINTGSFSTGLRFICPLDTAIAATPGANVANIVVQDSSLSTGTWDCVMRTTDANGAVIAGGDMLRGTNISTGTGAPETISINLPPQAADSNNSVMLDCLAPTRTRGDQLIKIGVQTGV
ncbi:MAG: hypothetical protein QJT81_08590 [Candidatus Thiothrix putei]|uniref:Uncharacterized protein n=1 Tax=Candidatus Thiothrix putei TaxID=3080811 RepID=A0AA95KS58_9GAMM|nr:MAG: hypothetical protein QJT81_08590 [Candidatus Thiothrix putei]